jgi:hypothetical protein
MIVECRHGTRSLPGAPRGAPARSGSATPSAPIADLWALIPNVEAPSREVVNSAGGEPAREPEAARGSASGAGGGLTWDRTRDRRIMRANRKGAASGFSPGGARFPVHGFHGCPRFSWA